MYDKSVEKVEKYEETQAILQNIYDQICELKDSISNMMEKNREFVRLSQEHISNIKKPPLPQKWITLYETKQPQD